MESPFDLTSPPPPSVQEPFGGSPPVEFVCGFLFSSDRTRILLIRKARPEWQAGLLNGIGGKVESTDPSFHRAMDREFSEETTVPLTGWQIFAYLVTERKSFVVAFFVRFLQPEEERFSFLGTPDEPVSWYHLEVLASRHQQCVPSLSWLIPLALEGGQRISYIFNQTQPITGTNKR